LAQSLHQDKLESNEKVLLSLFITEAEWKRNEKWQQQHLDYNKKSI